MPMGMTQKEACENQISDGMEVSEEWQLTTREYQI
jgi:hypothetical protein